MNDYTKTKEFQEGYQNYKTKYKLKDDKQLNIFKAIYLTHCLHPSNNQMGYNKNNDNKIEN